MALRWSWRRAALLGTSFVVSRFIACSLVAWPLIQLGPSKLKVWWPCLEDCTSPKTQLSSHQFCSHIRPQQAPHAQHVSGISHATWLEFAAGHRHQHPSFLPKGDVIWSAPIKQTKLQHMTCQCLTIVNHLIWVCFWGILALHWICHRLFWFDFGAVGPQILWDWLQWPSLSSNAPPSEAA